MDSHYAWSLLHLEEAARRVPTISSTPAFAVVPFLPHCLVFIIAQCEPHSSKSIVQRYMDTIHLCRISCVGVYGFLLFSTLTNKTFLFARANASSDVSHEAEND